MNLPHLSNSAVPIDRQDIEAMLQSVVAMYPSGEDRGAIATRPIL